MVRNPALTVDFNRGRWVGLCEEHGEVIREPNSVQGHNRVVVFLARHDELQHDGDGMVHYSQWLF